MRIKNLFTFIFIALLIPNSFSFASEIIQTSPAHIGEQAILSVNSSAIPSGGSVEWSLSPTTGKNPARISLRAGGRELAFTPLDTQPLKVIVNFTDRDGKIIKTEEETINIQEFEVTASVVVDKPVTLWDSVKRANFSLNPDIILANSPVRVRASLNPKFNGEYSLKWVVDAATAILSQEGSDVIIKRSSVGESEITVTAFNSTGIRLGSGSSRVKIQLPVSEFEESSRQREAWQSWQHAKELWESENYSDALEAANKAIRLAPRDSEIAEGLKAMNTNFTRFTRANKLRVEAANLTSSNKFDDALKNLRSAQVIWPIDEGDQEIKEAEERANEYRILLQQANWLRDTASAYDNENMFEEALEYYGKSIEIMPNEAISARMERIKERLIKIADADKYAGEGNTLEREGKLQDALNRYAASILSNPDASLRSHVEELQSVIQKRERQAAALFREGRDFQQRNNNQEALKRYRESMNIWPNDNAASRIKQLARVKLAPDTVIRSPEDFGIGTRLDAQKIIAQADDLYSDGETDEALKLYRKAQSIYNSPELRDWLARLESNIKERDTVNAANSMIYNANTLYKNGKRQEAINLYRQSLNVHANPEIEEFLKREGAAK